MTIQKFEDLFSWQKARELNRQVYEATQQAPFRYDRGLVSQIERAAVSAMANQAEGFTRGTKVELINYFYIAKGSAGEVQSHLYTALDARYIDISTFRNVYGLADETQRLIESFVKSVKQGGQRGIQYRQGDKEKARRRREIEEKITRERAAGRETGELFLELLRLDGLPV